MTKKILVFIVVIVILAGAGYAVSKIRSGNDLSSEKAAKLEVTEYSSEGQVVSIGEGSIVISAGRVERTEEDGNQFVNYERTIRFADTVQFTEKGNKTEISADKLSSSLKVGDRAVFYGTVSSGSPTEGELLASRVDILSRGTTNVGIPSGQ